MYFSLIRKAQTSSTKPGLFSITPAMSPFDKYPFLRILSTILMIAAVAPLATPPAATPRADLIRS
jgi:hypothetical protein